MMTASFTCTPEQMPDEIYVAKLEQHASPCFIGHFTGRPRLTPSFLSNLLNSPENHFCSIPFVGDIKTDSNGDRTRWPDQLKQKQKSMRKTT